MMDLSRRNFLKVAVGAGAALLVPERKVWALDQTMIPREGTIITSGSFVRIHEGVGGYAHDQFPQSISMGDYTYRDELPDTVLWKYDWVQTHGKYWGVVLDPVSDSAHSEVLFITEQEGMYGVKKVAHSDIVTYRSIVGESS